MNDGPGPPSHESGPGAGEGGVDEEGTPGF